MEKRIRYISAHASRPLIVLLTRYGKRRTVRPHQHSGGKSAVEGGTLTAVLPKKSWNMIRLGK
jgi:hypothetical protein